MTRRHLPFALLFLAAPLAAQAPRTVTIGRPVTDSLTARDPVRRTAHAPYHVWRFDGRRGQRITVDLSSPDFDPYLIARDADGFPLGADDDSGHDLAARLHLILPRDGSYQFIATASASDSVRGVYTLTVSGWETPPAPAAGRAAALAPGETKTGVLEPGDEVGADGPYEDRWTADLPAGARLRAELRSEDLDAFLTVLDPDGALLGSDDDGLGDRNSRVSFRAARAGRYTLVASSYGDAPRSGAYRITLAVDSGDFADAGQTAAIRPGETKEGRLEAGDLTGPRGLEDRWTFEGRAGEVVRLDAVSSDFDPYLVLRNGPMAVDSNDDGGTGLNARVVAVLPASGTYTAVVSGFSEERSGGRYTLALTTSAPPPAPSRVGRIAIGQRVAGRLEPGDEARPEGGLQDAWEFEGRSGQDVTVELRSSAFDTYLELRDPRGDLVAENDDGLGEGTDSFVSAHLAQGGRYRILVRAYGDGEEQATGLYELAVGTVTPPAPPGRVVDIRLGETYSGRLEEGDSTLGDSSYADVYTFRATASGSVVIQLRSSDFDAYLILQDADGQALASDDDGGSGTDSRLSYDVVAGRRYRILANSYGGDRRTGLYRLTVSSGP